ncbi:B-cell receptor CD22-like [Leptodactylus fuscus]
MESMKQIYLLLICQGFYLGSVGQRWTFPSTMTALIGSCVEIPCTYTPGRKTRTSRTEWVLPRSNNWYKDRLVHALGGNICTLRIDPVREGDGDTVYIDLYISRTLKEGEATVIRCSVDHTCGFRPPSLQWNKPGQVIKKSVNISGGSWREESELTYIPSYVDDGSSVQCTAIYPNGIFFCELGTLNIIYSPKNVTVTVIGMDEVKEGTNVTLQCNSFSKPMVYEYEWYKGKTRLPDRGREMTVYNVTGDMEPYSCTAINRVGRGESPPIQIPVLRTQALLSGFTITHRREGNIKILLGCFTQTDPSPDATYIDLVREDIGTNYDQLKPAIPIHTFPISGGRVHADTSYENVHR